MKLRGSIAGCQSCASIVVSCGAANCACADGPKASEVKASAPAMKGPTRKVEAARARHLSFDVIRGCLGRRGQGDGMLQDILDHGRKSTKCSSAVAGRPFGIRERRLGSGRAKS